jgi:glycosyltransferase involved in cell wall biosynthesis
VNSILAQTFGDFEILIMDDHSPDNTPEVAASFKDPRVKHVRNDPNLGHLRNYNKGIEMSRGKYVWLISADDYLREPYVLERYVQLMEAHPTAGFVFCPGVKVRGGKEAGTLDYSLHGKQDKVFEGRKFLAKLLKENTIVAASGMVRKECYDKISVFPLDMPWGGDWYLWCVFALHTDVGYLAEPMVCYREHELSMTNKLMEEDVAHCTWEDLHMPWTMKKKVEEAGYTHLVKYCLDSAAYDFARRIAAKRYRTASASMTIEQFEEQLCKSTPDEKERDFVRGRVYAAVGDAHYWQGNNALASQFYSMALKKGFTSPKIWAKRLLLASGGLGNLLRKGRANFVRQ